LSDLLSYIVYESDDESVPLKKELNALNEYIRMENQGFADSFESTITVLGDAANYRITPLLLFPYVEHSFEYFESIHPVLGSLNINISVGGTFLLVELVLMHHTDKEMAPHKPKLEDLIRRLDRISPLKSPIKRKWASDGLRITIGFALNYFEKETIAEMSPQLP
jgi:LytS/YehU family sensor histidine kinase